MLRIKVWMWTLGLWTVVTYLVCVLYGLVTPESIHMHSMLETMFPGFKWLNPFGFVLGLVESFLYGAYAGIILVPVHNFFYRRWGAGGYSG